MKGNESLSLFHGVNVAANANGAPIQIESGEGAFYLDVTADAGTTPTLDVDIEELDPTSGKWFVIASFTQVTTTLGNERILSPSTVSTGAPERGGLPGSKYRAAVTVTGTPDYDFTVGFAGLGN